MSDAKVPDERRAERAWVSSKEFDQLLKSGNYKLSTSGRTYVLTHRTLGTKRYWNVEKAGELRKIGR